MTLHLITYTETHDSVGGNGNSLHKWHFLYVLSEIPSLACKMSRKKILDLDKKE